jgi:hydroxypyruvate reductase
VQPPAILLSGGETTVTLSNGGTGGPNQEFTLSAALELSRDDITVASVDTDGIDGTSEAAGGIATRISGTSKPAARQALQEHNAGEFLEHRDALIVTGQTGTNVNDLRIFVIPDV